jgi:transposase
VTNANLVSTVPSAAVAEPPRVWRGLHRVSEDGVMAKSSRHPRELRERAVALVFEQVEQYSSQWDAIKSISAKVDVSTESLRRWVRQAEVDAGVRPKVDASEAVRVRELERENLELRRANEILKAASIFFARELDPRPPHS